jgi:uncharacterized protein
MKLTLEEGTTAVHYARSVITAVTTHHPHTTTPLNKPFTDKHGVFCTLHTHPDHDLRGCIGIPYPHYTLKDALEEAARSVTHDPRFPPLHPDELDHIIVEITILSKPTPITANTPQDILKKIKIGRDGLIIEHAGRSGLFLPQVPIEQHWDIETYLAELCMKAWLPPDSWLMPDAKLYTFTGQIFTETTPHGTIQETTLNGPQH